jgi:hypothetical protein
MASKTTSQEVGSFASAIWSQDGGAVAIPPKKNRPQHDARCGQRLMSLAGVTLLLAAPLDSRDDKLAAEEDEEVVAEEHPIDPAVTVVAILPRADENAE